MEVLASYREDEGFDNDEDKPMPTNECQRKVSKM